MATANSTIIKRSVRINHRKTSVSLEDQFWSSAKEIAQEHHVSLQQLLTALDHLPGRGNLSSALRLYVIEYYKTVGDPRLHATPH